MSDYDDYQIIKKRFGAGGSGYVHKARDPNGRIVALKVPSIAFTEETTDISVIQAYQNEAEVWQKLCRQKIPGIVELYEYGVFNGIPWLAMEFMEGGDLKTRMPKLSLDEKLAVMKKLLATLSEVHLLGVIHRDIKPENILFTKEGDPRISDWGLSKVLLTTKTPTVNPKMSIHYAAPEQFSKKIKVDGRTDIYQFGATCFELLTGRYVFPGDDLMEAMSDIANEEPEPPSKLVPEIPAHVNEIILKCLEKKKEDRFRSMYIVLDRLVNAGGTKGVQKANKGKKAVKAEASGDEQAQSEQLLVELDKRLNFLKEAGDDVAKSAQEMNVLRKYVQLKWYDEVKKQGGVLLKHLKERCQKELARLETERKELMKEVRHLFKECLSKDLDIQSLYSVNEEAILAYKKEDFELAKKLFCELKESLEGLLEENAKRTAAREEFIRLKANEFGVAPLPGLQNMLETDLPQAQEQLAVWRDGIEKSRLAEEKRKKEEAKRKRQLKEQRMREKRELEEKKKKELEEQQKREKRAAEEKRKKELEEQRKRELDKKQKKEQEQQRIRDTFDNSKQEVVISTTVQVPVRKNFLRTSTEEKDIVNIVEMRTNSMGIEFIFIPAGTFTRGSYPVTISKPFYLGKYQVTQAQWKAVMGNNPSAFKGDTLPIEKVSWEDCQKFIRKLNEKEGTTKYRLPTNAEWEYACRAGTTTKFSFGDDESKLSQYGWYGANSGSNTQPVGQKKPNSWSLYDMHGNVWEWCSDWYENYPKNAVTDPAGPGSGSYRVNRGGCWGDSAGGCTAAIRYRDHPGLRNFALGFRLARSF